MTRKQAVEKLEKLQDSDDTEAAHGDADDVLCDFLGSLGYVDVVAAYNKINHAYPVITHDH